MSHVSSHDSPRALVTQPRVIPFETYLVLTLGYKLLILVSHFELKPGPRFADSCSEGMIPIRIDYCWRSMTDG